MSGRGRPRGSHRSASTVLNPSLQGSANQDHTSNAERMDVQPVKHRTCVGTGVANKLAQPEDGSAPLIDWPEEGQLEDADPTEVPAVPLSQSVAETPTQFADTTQGESHDTAVAILSDLLAQTGVESTFDRVPNADYVSPLMLNSRILFTGPGPVRLLETAPASQNSVTDLDLVRISQRYRPKRLAAPNKTEIVTPRRRKRTELEMQTL
jgi:hypothetical protein